MYINKTDLNINAVVLFEESSPYYLHTEQLLTDIFNGLQLPFGMDLLAYFYIIAFKITTISCYTV